MIPMKRQRDYTLDHALVLANASLKQLNMDCVMQEIAKTENIYTHLCLLLNHELKITFRGAGSGSEQESQVKAIYEAIEDSLLYQTLSRFDDNRITMFSTISSPSSDFLEENEILPDLLKQDEYLNKTYPWIKMNRLHAKEDALYYPLGLLFPHVDKTSISQIANSTGIAMGATEAEAMIHGINDWIERDAYGLFLLGTLIKKNKPARCISKQSLPKSIRNDIELIESTYADELMIIDITSDINIPVFFVSFTQQDFPVQPSGLGASLCKVDALQQALFEALQARDRYNSNTVSTIQHYQAYPVLLKAFKCDLVQLHEDGGTINIDWCEVVTHEMNIDLNKQIHFIMEKIKSLGIHAYFNILFQAVNGLTLMYVLLVGVETFGMMREGLFIPIKKRGWERLT